jgi:hypothetical protein
MNRPSEHITTQDLERALRVLAKLVAGRDGDLYVPFFVRIEDELKARCASSDVRARARALLQQDQMRA